MAAIYTTEEYTNLCKMLGQGILSTKFGDKEVVYRSLKEMKEIKLLMEIELGIKTAGRKTTYIQHSKGLL